MTKQAKQLPTEAERTANYEAELVRRYQAREYLTKADTAEARKILKRWRDGAWCFVHVR